MVKLDHSALEQFAAVAATLVLEILCEYLYLY